MTGVLLDTNTLSYYVDANSPFRAAVKERMEKGDRPLYMSVLSTYELALYDRMRAVSEPTYDSLLSPIDVVGAPLNGASVFADLKIALATSRGAKIRVLAKHNIDIALAATAIAEDLTLVSNDSIFGDLAQIDPRLTVEDWTT